MGSTFKVHLAQNNRGSKMGVTTSELKLHKVLFRTGICGIRQIVFGPTTMHLNLNMLWQLTCKLPTVNLSFSANILRFRIGPNTLLALQSLAGNDEEPSEKRSNSLLCNWTELIEPDAEKENVVEQHYLDDLRAGAFQFIRQESEQEPKPYQVIFSKASMNWKYPQPRTLTRVSVFPVPFLSASESASNHLNSEAVLCALQYWDQCSLTFQTYSEFKLSEDQVSHLDLPMIADIKRRAVSDLWRIVLYYVDGDEEGDGFEELERKVIVTPKSLVSVVRVDSFYASNLVPKFQVSLKVPSLACEVYNHFHFQGRKTREELERFVLNQTVPKEQLVANIKADSLTIANETWIATSKTSIGFDVKSLSRIKAQLRLDFVEYCFLTVQTLMEPTKIQGQVSYTMDDERKTLELNVVSKALQFRFGRFLMHTLRVSSQLWMSVLDSEMDPVACSDLYQVPLAFYILCNDTSEPIRFGQIDTEENILLRPQEYHTYTWRSQKAKLSLRVCVEGGYWKWCDPLALGNLSESKPTVRKISNGDRTIVLVFAVKKICTTQIQIEIKGLFCAANMLRDHLEFRLIPKPQLSEGNSSSNGVKPSLQEQRIVLPDHTTSPHFLLSPEEIQGVKIRLLGIGTPWSGEIPLTIDKGRKNSVLVRIPTKEKGHCLTIWCRVFEETVEGITRVLMILTPLYIANSLLPNKMQVILSCQKSNLSKTMEVNGRDVPLQLDTLGASDLKYSIAFKIVDSLPASEPIGMSWGLVEQVRQPFDEKNIRIDDVIQELLKRFSSSACEGSVWPFVHDEDEHLGTLPVSVWNGNEQPNTDVKVHFSQVHPLCNTLCLNVHPWCIIVNQTGTPLVLKCAEAKSLIDIANDSVLVPPTIHSTFQLGIQDNTTNDYFSPPLRLSDQEWHFRQLMPSFQGLIPMEGIVQTKIVLDNQICFLTIQSRRVHKIRIIHIRPTFLITNNTGQTLQCCPLSVAKARSEKKVDVTKIDLVSMEIQEHRQDQTTSLLLWQLVGEFSNDQLFDGFQYISIGFPHSEWSNPLNLEDCRSISEDRRRKIFVDTPEDDQFMNKSIVVTVHQRNGQIYVLVFEDENPDILLINNLNVTLHYAQFHPLEGVNDGGNETFWNQSQKVSSKKTSYFSFPWILQNFPLKESLPELPGIVLSAYPKKETAETEWEMVDDTSKWSISINTSLHHEEYISIPNFGDAKVTIEIVSNQVHVFVDPVSKIEFSAKDIRSRIPNDEIKGPVNQIEPLNTSSEELEDSYVTIKDHSATSDASFFTVVSPMTQPPTSRFHSMVEAEGESRVLDAANKQNRRLQIFACLFLDQVAMTLTDDCCEITNELSEYFRMTWDRVGLTYRPRFVFSTPLRSCENNLPRFTDFCLCVHGLQVDNQMYNKMPFDFAVILKEQENDSETGGRVTFQKFSDIFFEDFKRESFLNVMVVFDSCQSEMAAVKNVRVRIRPLDINLEDKLFYKTTQILSTFPDLVERKKQTNRLPSPLPAEIVLASNTIMNVLKLDEFTIESLDVSMSVHASVKMYIGLEMSPLNFSTFRKTNLVTNNYCLGQLLARHYISGALFRAGWVVGSLDLIGSPSGFTRTIGEGMKDFVAMPYQGIMTGPWSFIGGIANGSSSLVKHVSAGTVASMTNFASSVSRNMDRLSWDDEHCLRNEMMRREKPHGLGQGILNGLSGVGVSLLGAVGGFAHHPINALIDQGMSPSGLAKGFTKAMVGVVTKPLGGAAELVAQTGQGLLQGTGWSKRFTPVEPCLPEHVCNLSSSALKFDWKLINQTGRCTLLYMAEAIQGSESRPVTLVLTSEAILIVATEEDAQSQMKLLIDMDCSASEDDPTKLILEVKPYYGEDSNETAMARDRVARFVLESGTYCYLSDHESEKDELTSKTKDDIVVKSKDNNEELEFYTSPVVRDTFHDLFVIAKRQLRHKGFDML